MRWTFGVLALMSLAPGEVLHSRDSPLVPGGAGDPLQWTMVEPGGDTGCAFDTPFRFFHHAGRDPGKVLVYFQGGGACWNWVSCSGMFDQSVDTDEGAAFRRGIFDFENPENPFADHSVLFVPYCTGDVHVGDTVATYGEASWNAPPVRHWGYRNVTAALDWLDGEGLSPDRVVVTGASAGSYGAIFHAPRIAELFPRASLVVLGDSGVPLLEGYPAILDAWGAGRVLSDAWGAGDASNGITLEEAHAVIATVRPEATIAHITTDRDAVQAAFYIFSGSPAWRAATLDLLKDLEERLPNFRAFVLEGDQHGLMRTDDFYAFRDGGERLRDWVARLVAGHPVVSHYCQGC